MKNNKRRNCHNCDCCIYIGEGDYICDKGIPFIVMEDHCPSEYYCACNNLITFKEAQQLTEDVNNDELSDTLKDNKEVMKMTCEEETRQYVFNVMSTLKDKPQELREFLGTALCDGGCNKFKDDCTSTCAVFKALESYILEEDLFTKRVKYNQLKSVVGCKLHEINKEN